MTDQICDLKRIVGIISDSAYKATIFDVATGEGLRTIKLIDKTYPLFTLAAGTIAYSVRGISRECLADYVPEINGYSIAPYIGGILGNGVKYLINGYFAHSIDYIHHKVGCFALGAINGIGYELMTDFNLNSITATATATILEGSEIFTPVIYRDINYGTLDLLTTLTASLMVSAEIEYIYVPTSDYINGAVYSLYDKAEYSLSFMDNTTNDIYPDEL